MAPSGDLAGKVAIVTGGASGIGRATAEVLLNEGAQVVIGDVNAEAGELMAKELGASAAFTQADVSDADQVQALVDFAVAEFGGLHVMFNNAGIGGSPRRFLKDDFRDFEQMMAVNLLGVMLGAQRAGRHMAEHGGGVIINTTSIAGINAGVGFTTYRATKAAVIQLTRSWAIELAPHNIRVNCLAPAHIATAINTNYDIPEVVRTMQPLQRQGRPEDVANAVAYLASDKAAQVTGVVLPIDGGTTVGRPFDEAETAKVVHGR